MTTSASTPNTRLEFQMDDSITIEWTYTPEDFFEEPFIKKVGEYEFNIYEGKANAFLRGTTYDNDHLIEDRIYQVLEDIFLAAKAINQKKYNLLKYPNLIRTDNEGKRAITMRASPGYYAITGHAPDIKITNASGKVIKSTKEERINSIKNFVSRVLPYLPYNPTLKRILVSHGNASSDPKNELIHLYEIRDALVREFGNERETRKSLGIDRKKWSRFGQLANDLPLKEGRHRGNADEALRNASKEELNEARAFAKKLIESYLDYLDKNS